MTALLLKLIPRISKPAPVVWVIAIAAVYSLVAFVLMPLGVFWSPDNGMRYVQMQHIHWDAGLQIPIDYPGQALDPSLHVPPYHKLLYRVLDGQIYLAWPPYFALVSKLPSLVLGDAWCPRHSGGFWGAGGYG